ncbi:MAG: DUF1552 domain-containing protein [Planctomycetota bacterium]
MTASRILRHHLDPAGRLTRRALLRGAGVALALPRLDGLSPRRGEDSAPARMAFLFMPNGVLPSAWTPPDQGRSFTLSPTLEPLTPIRDAVTVLTGTHNANSHTGEGHYVKTTALLTGAPVRRTGGKDLRCGISVDQVAAQRRGSETRLPSLELGIEPPRHIVDMGYSTVYGATISWRAPDRPAVKETRPRLAFERLFRSAKLGGQADRSVLDVVLGDAARLRQRLGATDRTKVDEYLDAVRSLERRIERFDLREEERVQAAIGGRDVPGEPRDFPEHVQLMFDVVELAFRSDTTRIVTFMYGNAVSGRDFSFLDGVSGGHHPLSHHENDPDKKAQYQRINRWFVQSFADLCTRLRAVPEGDDSNLFDRTMLFFGSGIQDGNRHDPNDLPILLAGGSGWGIRHQGHLRKRRHTPLCNLYATLLDAFGAPVDQFGDSDGRFDELRG